MKKLAAMGALGLMASCLFAQGTNPGPQTKDDWEEINFEFNSSVLSDGYPSLLRLAELLGQHRDYKVKVIGHTDSVGSNQYNQRLSLSRANAVRDFLVKYGAGADQVTTEAEGKTMPEVNNGSKEGRFINRRVILTVTNAQGQVIKEGGISDVLKSTALEDLLKKEEDCCNQILRRLDKLDDILAALKNMQGENDKLRAQLDDLRNQHNALRDQVAGLPKPLTSQETTTIAKTEATNAANNALDEAQRRNKKFSVVGLNVGPAWGPNRFANGDFTVSGRAQFFSPFGGDGTHAVQAQGEYMYYPGRQEGQFDIGLVNRWGHLQAGGFGSFKYASIKEYQNGGALAQGAFLVDYIFSRGRVGAFATKGFRNIAVMNQANLGPSSFLQTYARVVDQYGFNGLVGTWGNAYLEGNIGYLRINGPGSDKPGAKIKLVQPLNRLVSFTAEAGLNETMVEGSDKGRVVFGLEFGNFIRPKEYGTTTSPVPMDVPRIRFQLLTRKVGNSAPVADAGPNQTGVPPGTITLDGSGSYDPDGDQLTYSWSQVGGPSVALSGANTVKPTFTAQANQTYMFRLLVKDPGGLQSTATTTVSAVTTSSLHIDQFNANPSNVQAGQPSTLCWTVAGATSVTITGVGSVNTQSGCTQVTPQQTTTYVLNATSPAGTVTAQTVVTVGPTGPAQVLRFEAAPPQIQAGQKSTLSWSTSGATQVSISPGVGNVMPNGSVDVTPNQTTTYTLTAMGPNGQPVSAPATVTVIAGSIPTVVTFVASPTSIDPGGSSKLCWQVTGATSVQIQPGIGTVNATDCVTVSPTATTTYTLTATNASGNIQANAVVNVGQVQILTFTANPAQPQVAGQAVTLSWTTSNATSVVLVGGDVNQGGLPVNGSIMVHPSVETAYTLTAYGPGGQSVSTTITVGFVTKFP
jgi:hypothetical protein